MTDADVPDPTDEPSPEDPSRFPDEPALAPLDESPEGLTHSDPSDSSDDSLPPGAG